MNNKKYLEYKEKVEKELKNYFIEYKKDSSYSSCIWDSMEYTTMLGGKRLRAIMALEIAKIFGAKENEILPSACALEMMHAYSLIHDDLPCMDNDDLRRGKPTNHKVFGEATAVLAGDALISFGAQLIIDKTPSTISKEIVLDIVRDYLIASGAKGIVAGQIADIEAQDKEIDIENLKYIHKFKTGALFKCAILIGAKIAKLQSEKLKKLADYADNFGILFQVYDDIIDYTLTSDELGKTAGKDAIENKLTYVKAYGLDEAKNIFYSLINKNHAILTEMNIESEIFDYIYDMLSDKIRK